MPIDFPNAPATNDLFTSGDRTWKWNGTAWTIVLPAISANSISSTELSDNSVTSSELADNSVTQAKLADRAVGSAELDNLTLNAQVGTTYTLVLTDAHKLITLNNASAITLTVPTNSSVAFDIGDQVNLVQLGAGQVTISGAGVTFRSEGSKLKTKGQYALVTLIKIDTNEWLVLGNTAA
jgi:hypothetical protein